MVLRKIDYKIKLLNFWNRYIKISVFEISLMAILLAILSVIKYITFILFKGPLNFNIEIIFWIVIGILFGPIKGPLFSILCDTVFTIFTTGIIYWMIEYAYIAPAISLISWFFHKQYKEKSNWTIWFSFLIQIALIALSITFFSLQIFSGFKYENVKDVFPIFAYTLIVFLNVSIIGFLSFCLISFKIKNEWKYIKWMYIFSLIILIIIIFRWLWGPYAYIAYLERFFSKNIDQYKQYWLTLLGIVSKSCLSIPLASAITIPIIHLIDINKFNVFNDNKY